MSVQILSKAAGEWRTVPNVSVSFDPFIDAITAMGAAAAEAASAVAGSKEAIRQDDWSAPVPVVAMPCSWSQGHEAGTATAVWSRQFGKRAVLRTEFTFEGPGHDVLMKVFEPLFAAARASTERRVARLAADLGLHAETARRQFNQVLHVLEAAGVVDGYGRLAIAQPVRPPVQVPARLS